MTLWLSKWFFLVLFFIISMIVASWNCRGAGSQNFPSTIRNLVKDYKVGILCLLETRISGPGAEKVVRKLGFTNWIRLEASSFPGRIWVLWNEDSTQVDYVFLIPNLFIAKCWI